eukprot:2848051-Rhodomonas_salina.1
MCVAAGAGPIRHPPPPPLLVLLPSLSLYVCLCVPVWVEVYNNAVPFHNNAVPFYNNAVPLRRRCTLRTCISVPLVFMGSYLGFRRPAIDFPCRTNAIPRQVGSSWGRGRYETLSRLPDTRHPTLGSCAPPSTSPAAPTPSPARFSLRP